MSMMLFVFADRRQRTRHAPSRWEFMAVRHLSNLHDSILQYILDFAPGHFASHLSATDAW